MSNSTEQTNDPYEGVELPSDSTPPNGNESTGSGQQGGGQADTSVQENSNNSGTQEKKEWNGIFYYFVIVHYWISYILWGEKAVTKPTAFIKTGNLKWLYYGGYKIKLNIKKFIQGPIKESEDLNFIEKLTLLLEPNNLNDSILQKSKDLTRLHRIHENTKARRRLEKWASRVIVIYLLIVLFLVLGNYISISYTGMLSFMNKISMNIPKPVMITILSTTTVNIIGLGLIVLRGHFLNKDDLKDELKKESNNNDQPQSNNTNER